MPYIGQTRDLSTQYLSYGREENDFRPVGNVTYNVGNVCQLVKTDSWIYPDACTVNLPIATTVALGTHIVGAVSDDFNGFNPIATPPSYLAPGGTNYLNQRGTTGVRLVTKGYHPGVLVDQSGTGAVTITNGVLLCSAVSTAGYACGYATAPTKGGQILGSAVLPNAGIGSSLTAASLAQASQTATIAGTVTQGDVYILTIQSSYNTVTPGTAQTTAWSFGPLTTAQAVSATTAAVAMIAYLNAQPSFSQYFIATNSAGAITVTVNTLITPFLVTFGTGSTLTGQFTIGISGMVANSLTFACSTGGSTVGTFTAGSTVLASGTGYLGPVPAWIGSYGNAGI